MDDTNSTKADPDQADEEILPDPVSDETLEAAAIAEGGTIWTPSTSWLEFRCCR
jgi:hypothetical protein